MNKLKSIIRLILSLGLIVLIAGALPFPVFAEESDMLELYGGDTLYVEGEEFSFSEETGVIDGEEVRIETAVWKGNVTARFGMITLTTGKVTVIFDGAEVDRLEAEGDVVLTEQGGRAKFSCSDIVVNFPTSTGVLETYTGILNQVTGSYLLGADDLKTEGIKEIRVNFRAESVRLDPNEAVLEKPVISIGDLDRPEFAMLSDFAKLAIGPHTVSGDMAFLDIRAPNVTIELFGNRINLLPFPVRSGFTHSRDPGWGISLPSFASDEEAGSGFHLNEEISYDFADKGIDNGPFFILRLDSYFSERIYPEIRYEGETGNFTGGIRTGYRRKADIDNNVSTVLSLPDIYFDSAGMPLGLGGLEYDGGVFWGHLIDNKNDIVTDRWGWHGSIGHPGYEIDNFSIFGGINFRDNYYRNGDFYRRLGWRAGVGHINPSHWSSTLTYQRNYQWGKTPLRYEIPLSASMITLEENHRFADRWGGGFELGWDFTEDHFERKIWHLTYILDSFQVSLGWDFENKTITMGFDLPGSLR
ncbi:MAG: hypothetical protein ABIC40_08420 [bacterium]